MLKSVSTDKTGTKVVSLGIGPYIDEAELKYIASEPIDKNVIHVVNFTQLPTVEEQLRNDACIGITTRVIVRSRVTGLLTELILNDKR